MTGRKPCQRYAIYIAGFERGLQARDRCVVAPGTGRFYLVTGAGASAERG